MSTAEIFLERPVSCNPSEAIKSDMPVPYMRFSRLIFVSCNCCHPIRRNLYSASPSCAENAIARLGSVNWGYPSWLWEDLQDSMFYLQFYIPLRSATRLRKR